MATNLLLSGMVLAVLFAVDPSDTAWGTEAVAALKYLPVALALSAVPVLLLGAKGLPFRDPAFLAAVSFASFVTCGGAYTLVSLGAGLGETFIGRGASALCVLPSFLLMHLPRERSYVQRAFRFPLFLGGTMMVVLLLAFRAGLLVSGQSHIYHEEAVYFAMIAGAGMTARTQLRRTLHVTLFGLASALTFKLTGFAFGLIALVALVACELARPHRRDALKIVQRRIAILQVAAVLAMLVVFGGAIYRTLLPSGSPEVRLRTYAERWDLFEQGPLFGQMFVGSPIMEAGWLIIPSHSDALDILAFGGLAGALLFLVPVGLALWDGAKSLPRFVDRRDTLQIACLVFFVSFLFELSFNPVLHQPKLVLFFWLSLGTLLADRHSQRLVMMGEAVRKRRGRSRVAPVSDQAQSIGG